MSGAAIVVGVGPGLGSALVRKFAAEGLTVVAAARHATGLTGFEDDVAAGRVELHDCDATEPVEIEEIFTNTEKKFGQIKVTVFNAGAFERGHVADTDPADFERCWRVGCFAGFLTGRAAAQRMLAHNEGTIIFTGATASLRGGAGFSNLAVPKFALRALAQSMARELGPQGIHVAHVVIDGGISSPRYAEMAADLGPDALLKPEAIADTYLALHRQHRSAWTLELELRPWVEKF
ncbi:MAG: SDR family NAD(P)-dependent oxidoreductase [Gammaproteobacteria bacterium]|nr:MAG: SDR family NAD(P)-dependent oxidoreductase [Gammaproteobacteria bacterium]